ncbi:MAG: TolC family protein [Campylobacterales bacterium]|nr:TolC family protein [Campylobacterales bacterium]
MRAFRVSFILSLLLCSLEATEEFTIDEMRTYLTPENPYIYSSLGKKFVNEQKLIYAQGAYDTNLVAKYDEKDYPYTDGNYYSAGLEKATESGVEFSGGYRYAEGTQEYNNIKTGKNGEFLLGAKVPLLSVLNRIDERRLQLYLAQMDIKNADYAYKESMRSLYFTIMSEYYRLLYNNALLEVAKAMYLKVEKRKEFLEKRVKEGTLPQISLYEAKQQLIHAQQDFTNIQRAYESNFIEFLKYMDLSKESFYAQYTLPTLPEPTPLVLSEEEAMSKALTMRSDFKIFDTEIEKLMLEQKNNELKKYPKLDIGLYGVYDVNDETGFKLSLNMSFPIEQNRYDGKNAQIQESIKIINSDKEIRLRELKADLQRIMFTLNTLEENISNAKEERELLQALESAERRKYSLGSSTLFLLNQREIATVQAEKKILQYKLEYQLLYESYKRIISMHTLES